MAVHGIDDITGQTSHVGVSDKKLKVANYVWDTGTLSWIRQSVDGGSGPAANVTVTSTVGLTDAQLRASPIPVTSSSYAARVDDLTSVMYIGKATSGSSDASSVWQIKRIVFSGTTTDTTWANGSTTFNNIWNNRAALSYS
jgi:hypothetical protein